MKAKLGPEHPDTLLCMDALAGVYLAAEKLDLAVPLYEETFKLMKAKLGPEHPNTLLCMANLASAYKAVGKLDLAIALYQETLKLMKATSAQNIAKRFGVWVVLLWHIRRPGSLPWPYSFARSAGAL